MQFKIDEKRPTSASVILITSIVALLIVSAGSASLLQTRAYIPAQKPQVFGGSSSVVDPPTTATTLMHVRIFWLSRLGSPARIVAS